MENYEISNFIEEQMESLTELSILNTNENIFRGLPSNILYYFASNPDISLLLAVATDLIGAEFGFDTPITIAEYEEEIWIIPHTNIDLEDIQYRIGKILEFMENEFKAYNWTYFHLFSFTDDELGFLNQLLEDAKRLNNDNTSTTVEDLA